MLKLRAASMGIGLTVFAAMFAGCGISEPSSTPTRTVTITASPEPSTPEPSEPGPNEDDGLAAEEESTSKVLPPEKANVDLVLADFFEPGSEWSQSVFDVADQRNIQGVSTQTSACGEDATENPYLELRLANQFRKLTFKVGLSARSESPNAPLIVQTLGDGDRLLVSKRVAFNGIQSFDVPLDGVYAATIRFFQDSASETCGYESVDPVLFDVKVS